MSSNNEKSESSVGSVNKENESSAGSNNNKDSENESGTNDEHCMDPNDSKLHLESAQGKKVFLPQLPLYSC